MNNKRGMISGEVVMFIPKIIFLMAVLFAVVLLVKVFIVTTIDVRQVESNILVSRLLYSKGGLSYFDETIQRLYPGIIDLNKFEQLSKYNPNTLDNWIISYGEDNPIIAAKITLKYGDKKEIAVFYNKDRFDKWEPRALSTVKGGAGSVKSFEARRYILVKEGEKFFPAFLEFYMLS